MNRVGIYQIKNIEKCKYAFRDYDLALKNNFSIRDYRKSYECVRDLPENIIQALDTLYYEFNQCRPKDFKSHSLSVSDIIDIDGSKYYCDDCGWTKV